MRARIPGRIANRQLNGSGLPFQRRAGCQLKKGSLIGLPGLLLRGSTSILFRFFGFFLLIVCHFLHALFQPFGLIQRLALRLGDLRRRFLFTAGKQQHGTSHATNTFMATLLTGVFLGRASACIQWNQPARAMKHQSRQSIPRWWSRYRCHPRFRSIPAPWLQTPYWNPVRAPCNQ